MKPLILQKNRARKLPLFIILILISFKTVQGQCPTEVAMNINRKGNVVTVKPGAQLSLEFNYSIANNKTCPGCIDQIMVGLENQYLDCLYSGMPFVCPMPCHVPTLEGVSLHEIVGHDSISASGSPNESIFLRWC